MARSPEGLLTMQQAYNEVRMLAVLAKQYRLDQLSGSFGQAEVKPAADSAPTDCGPCPKCAGSSISFSRADSFLERELTSWGIQLCRWAASVSVSRWRRHHRPGPPARLGRKSLSSTVFPR